MVLIFQCTVTSRLVYRKNFWLKMGAILIQFFSQKIDRLNRHGKHSFISITSKILQYTIARLTPGIYLRQVNEKGARLRTAGKPFIENHGYAKFGDGIQLRSVVVPIDIYVAPSANFIIGNYVNINYGTAISCFESIIIGNNVRIGTYVQISDSNQHSIYNRSLPPSPERVVLEDDVWIGSRSIILPGTTIGKASVVAAGAVVTKSVRPYTIVAGVPAKEIKEIDRARFLSSN